MCHLTLSALVCAATLIVTDTSAWATVDYLYDDGTMNVAVGPPSSFPSDPDMGWGNYFTAQTGGEMITSVSFAMGPTFPTGREVRIAIFDDPDDDGDPSNATFLSVQSVVPEFLGGSQFNVVSVTPVQVSGGFFVCIFAWAEAGIDRPAAEDTSVTTPASWLIYNPIADGANLDNLGANAFIGLLNDFTPFPGVWMIRAVGEPIGTPCPADIVENGAVDVFDLLELLGNWGTNDVGADIAEPTDVVDVFDLLALLSAWGGCP